MLSKNLVLELHGTFELSLLMLYGWEWLNCVQVLLGGLGTLLVLAERQGVLHPVP